jgi:serine/threonine-protein kinase
VGIGLDGTLYVADSGNNEVRAVAVSGVVTTFAGATTSGKTEGVGSTARFNNPVGIAADASGALYIADTSNNKIRKVN